MLNTFIQMMAAVNDPEAIERGYQILSAKRDLIARQKAKTREFVHSYTEPRPLATAPRSAAGLTPSFDEAMSKAYTKGKWLLEIHGGTPQMHMLGFTNGSRWQLRGEGSEYSSVAEVSTGRRARIRNKYLKLVFVPA